MILSQAVGGDLSWESVTGAIFRPARLTPDERKTLADRMVGGANPVVKAAAEIATNPWVWAMFLATPVGEKALMKGLPFSWVAKKFSAYQRDNGGLLKHLMTPINELRGTGFENASLAVQERLAYALRDVLGKSNLDEAVKGLLAKFDDLHGKPLAWDPVDPLNPMSYGRGSVERAMVEEYQNLVTAKAARLDMGDRQLIKGGKTKFNVKRGLDETGGTKVEWPAEDVQSELKTGHLEAVEQARLDATRKMSVMKMREEQVAWNQFRKDNPVEAASRYPRGFEDWWTERGFEAVPVKSTTFMHVNKESIVVEKNPAILEPGKLDKRLAAYGEAHAKYLDAVKDARQRMFFKALGDEKYYAETGKYLREDGSFAWDDDKLTNLLTNLRRERKGTVANIDADAAEVQGKELLMSIVGQEGWETAKEAAQSPEGVRKVVELLKQVVEPTAWEDPYWMPRNTYRVGKIKVNGEWKVPPSTTSTHLRQAEVAPWAASVGDSRVTPLTAHADVWDPEYLKWLKEADLMTKDGVKFIDVNQQRIDGAWLGRPGKPNPVTGEVTRTHPMGSEGKLTMVRTARFHDSTEKYLRDMGHMAVVETNPAPAYLVDLDDRFLKEGYIDEFVGANKKSTVAGGVEVLRNQSLKEVPNVDPSKITIADLFERMHQGLKSEYHQGLLREMTGSLVGRMGIGHVAVHDSILQSRKYAKDFADGFLGKVLEKHAGKRGKAFVDGLREYGDPGSLTKPRDVGGLVASYLYTTHLGLNLSSALTNLTQPLLMAATAAPLSDVVGAWAASVGEMLDYAADRATSPRLVVNQAEKLARVRKNFRFASFDPLTGGKSPDGINLIGIGPNQHDVLDSMVGRSDTAWDKTVRFMMSPFEKSEWMNRNFSAHLMKRLYDRHGMSIVGDQFMQDAKGFMMRTQFAQDPMNTPDIFKNLPALLKQFLSFPTRQLTGALSEFPVMGGEENYWRGLWNTVGRGMGMSAIVYEAGKHLAGVDMSNGLFARGTTAMFQGEGVLPVPPVLSIPMDFIKAASGEDVNGLANTLARLVPGGVALSRAMGVMPDLSDNWMTALPGLLQKTYVDWNDPAPTGEVPLYKHDGTFVGYHNPSLLIAKGLGVDLGKFRTKGELDFYLSKQADMTREYKRRYLTMLAGNDLAGAQGVAAEYFDRVKVPLTVSRDNVQGFLRSQTRARGERILDRLPAEARPAYAAYVEAGGMAANLPPGALQRGATATRRDPDRANAPSMEDVRRMVAAHQQAVAENPSAFGGFTAFGR